MYKLCLASSEEEAVARKLEEWQFTFKERLRDCYGTNYFLYQIYSIDIIIGFTVLPKFYLSITIYKTIPLSAIADISLYTRETGEYVQIQGNYIGQNYNKLLAHSRRGEHCVKSNKVYKLS